MGYSNNGVKRGRGAIRWTPTRASTTSCGPPGSRTVGRWLAHNVGPSVIILLQCLETQITLRVSLLRATVIMWLITGGAFPLIFFVPPLPRVRAPTQKPNVVLRALTCLKIRARERGR